MLNSSPILLRKRRQAVMFAADVIDKDVELIAIIMMYFISPLSKET